MVRIEIKIGFKIQMTLNSKHINVYLRKDFCGKYNEFLQQKHNNNNCLIVFENNFLLSN